MGNKRNKDKIGSGCSYFVQKGPNFYMLLLVVKDDERT